MKSISNHSYFLSKTQNNKNITTMNVIYENNKCRVKNVLLLRSYKNEEKDIKTIFEFNLLPSSFSNNLCVKRTITITLDVYKSFNDTNNNK